MYESFFGLQEPPFNVTPDPRFVFLSRHHQAALSAMKYGVERRSGFIQITGEIGAGKTTISRMFLQQIGENVHTSLVFNPKLSELELLEVIVEDFGLKPLSRKRKGYFDALNRFLLEESSKGFNAVLIIDEAQLLPPKALEQIRLLSNLETTSQKLLQIILMGQPELNDLLNRPDLKQLKQRIAVRCHLPELNLEELGQYLTHRLSVAGVSREIFMPDAVRRVHELSSGIPRVVNILADRALLAAFTAESPCVDANMVECAESDLQGAFV
ncbi:MAG TPA: AAA family ATPase [Candidatus Omnitrophota bacterium]|jgi:general secretion pathway protein A|nr:AAA family ATPase [Candidatus Omnitrophota bacterium]